ncbi:MAG TPA: hypothetical protein VFU13_23525 [Steroidobacteraceae bacterium]|nr:hypothetical protein [Steroidobacteraceae bacterium]
MTVIQKSNKTTPVPNELKTATPLDHQAVAVEQEPVGKDLAGENIGGVGRWGKLGSFVGNWLVQRYAAVRVVTRMKILSFGMFLTYLGLGFAIRVKDIDVTGRATGIDFLLSSPGVAEVAGATVAVIFISAANVYAVRSRQRDEHKILRLAANRHSDPKFRDAVLRKYQAQ